MQSLWALRKTLSLFSESSWKHAYLSSYLLSLATPGSLCTENKLSFPGCRHAVLFQSKVPTPPRISSQKKATGGNISGVYFCPADSTQNWAHKDTNQRAPAYSPACGRALRSSKPDLPACHLIIKMLFKQVSMGTRLNASTLSSCLFLITSEPFGTSQPEVDRKREKMQIFSSIISTRADQVVERESML